MKKSVKVLCICVSVVAAIAILLSVAGPYAVLSGAKQPEVEAEYNYSEYLPLSRF